MVAGSPDADIWIHLTAGAIFIEPKSDRVLWCPTQASRWLEWGKSSDACNYACAPAAVSSSLSTLLQRSHTVG